LPRLEDLSKAEEADAGLLRELAVIKLNGGLGTSMGLERAKSLMAVKGESSFLDFIARQILHLRGGHREPGFYLMNSFSTREDTLQALEKYPDLGMGEPLDFLQNKVPKLAADTLAPIDWAADRDLEWCPPGHGDIYGALAGSGLMDRLLERGIRVLFVSNADNLGATVDVRLLKHFVASGLSFLMEVADRTEADRKGGHLARRKSDGRLLLRESAQALKAEVSAFQDVGRYAYFNTNNLWIRLDHLKAEMERLGGTLPLPLIINRKTVDPKSPESPAVLQLESAMGAAIECFERSGAVAVGRERFAPVKTTADLLGVRSDAFRVTEDDRLVLDERREGRPPLLDLDARYYRVMAQFAEAFGGSIPSLIDCESLRVEGAFKFSPGVVFRGRVILRNSAEGVVTVPPGDYADVEKTW
jgi:UDP-N-acetylglucosamine pyrophosphorylase